MQFKHHSKGRHHIPRQSHRVTNWRDYDAALRNRGSLTIWFTDEALAGSSNRGWFAKDRYFPIPDMTALNLAVERLPEAGSSSRSTQCSPHDGASQVGCSNVDDAIRISLARLHPNKRNHPLHVPAGTFWHAQEGR